MATSPSSQRDVVFGLGGPGGAATLVALKGGGADALVGALVVVGLLALARKLIRLAGYPAPDQSDGGRSRRSRPAPPRRVPDVLRSRMRKLARWSDETRDKTARRPRCCPGPRADAARAAAPGRSRATHTPTCSSRSPASSATRSPSGRSRARTADGASQYPQHAHPVGSQDGREPGPAANWESTRAPRRSSGSRPTGGWSRGRATAA